MSVKDIVNKFNKKNQIPKKIIYKYCIEKKNEI